MYARAEVRAVTAVLMVLGIASVAVAAGHGPSRMSGPSSDDAWKQSPGAQDPPVLSRSAPSQRNLPSLERSAGAAPGTAMSPRPVAPSIERSRAVERTDVLRPSVLERSPAATSRIRETPNRELPRTISPKPETPDLPTSRRGGNEGPEQRALPKTPYFSKDKTQAPVRTVGTGVTRTADGERKGAPENPFVPDFDKSAEGEVTVGSVSARTIDRPTSAGERKPGGNDIAFGAPARKVIVASSPQREQAVVTRKTAPAAVARDGDRRDRDNSGRPPRPVGSQAAGVIAGGGPGHPYWPGSVVNVVAGGGVPYPATQFACGTCHRHPCGCHRWWYDDCFHPHMWWGWNLGYRRGNWTFSLCSWWPRPYYYRPVYAEVPVVYTDYVYRPVYVYSEPVVVCNTYDEIDRLITRIKYGDAYERKVAARELGYEYSYRALEPLTYALLTDPDPDVRYQAARSLGRLGYREALPALRRAADTDPDDAVRGECEDAIHRIIRG